ncbi:MAG: penicillin acylase family protein [Candidatus Latescibacteria bacterium]|jgi:acyl-homoserine lactone acylase PvdQ|nr:penicillin acylase family protein [Candidatus Latescibacterota bacterium]
MSTMISLLVTSVLFLLLVLPTEAHAGKIEIIRDNFGVPHIFADTAFDGSLGLGYAQAEDNLDVVLRYVMESRACGAKVEGNRRNIEQDFLLRTFRLPEINRVLYEQMTPEERAQSDGFAEGINLYIQQHPDRKPDWFDHMTGLDAVAVIKVYQFRQQWSDVMKDMRGVAPADREIDRAGGDDGGASNQWCVGPARSQDGEAMLLSDPHLPWSGPAKWYESHITIGDRWIYGAGFFAFAGVGIGFTQDVAWGGTNSSSDMADVYRESLNPDNPNQYLYEGQWRDITTRVVEIDVRGRGKMKRTKRYTHHGPIISEDTSKNVAYAARLAALETMNLARTVHPYFNARTIHDLYRADSGGDFHKGHRVMIDSQGNIGYIFHACTHQRDDSLNWRQPVDGTTLTTEWGPRIPLENLPHMFNPPSGFIQNCNNNPYTNTPNSPIEPKDYPGHLSSKSTVLRPNQRAFRAMELLDALDRTSFDDMARISMDVKCLTADPYLNVILKSYEKLPDRLEGNGDVKQAVNILSKWDKMATVDNRALPILTTFVEVAGNRTPGRKPRPEQVAATFEKALQLMVKRWGSVSIPWGDVHVLQRGNQLLPLPGAGSTRSTTPFTTLYMTGTSKMAEDRWPADRGSSWMMLVKYHRGSVEAKTILPWGNSPDAQSPHFADQAPLFSKRQYKRALLTREEIVADAKSTIILKR